MRPVPTPVSVLTSTRSADFVMAPVMGRTTSSMTASAILTAIGIMARRSAALVAASGRTVYRNSSAMATAITAHRSAATPFITTGDGRCSTAAVCTAGRLADGYRSKIGP